MTVRTNLLLPKDLVDEVDRYAGPRGRSRFVADALIERLRRERLREAVERTAGAWSSHPEFQTAEDVVAWVRARRAEETEVGDAP